MLPPFNYLLLPSFRRYLLSSDSEPTSSPLSTSWFYKILFLCLSGVKFYLKGRVKKRFKHHLLNNCMNKTRKWESTYLGETLWYRKVWTCLGVYLLGIPSSDMCLVFFLLLHCPHTAFRRSQGLPGPLHMVTCYQSSPYIGHCTATCSFPGITRLTLEKWAEPVKQLKPQGMLVPLSSCLIILNFLTVLLT